MFGPVCTILSVSTSEFWRSLLLASGSIAVTTSPGVSNTGDHDCTYRVAAIDKMQSAGWHQLV